jgi:hypothetical protein
MSEKVNTFNLYRSTINIIFENRLSKNEILILLYLSRRVENAEDLVYFENNVLAKNFNVSVENIKKAKYSLKKKGVIFVEGYSVSITKEGGAVPFENSFFNFVSANCFTAAQLKALIFIVKTSHQVFNDKKICYISKTKFKRDTGSGPAVILKVLRMLCAKKMLVDMKAKNHKKIAYYRNLSFAGKGALIVTESKWKLNFNGGKTWKQGSSNKCKNRGQIDAKDGSNNCSDAGQKTAIKEGQISSEYNSPTSSLLNDSPQEKSSSDQSSLQQDKTAQVQDSSLTIVNDDFNEEDDCFNKLREKAEKSELSKRDKQLLDMIETAKKRELN